MNKKDMKIWGIVFLGILIIFLISMSIYSDNRNLNTQIHNLQFEKVIARSKDNWNVEMVKGCREDVKYLKTLESQCEIANKQLKRECNNV